VPSLKIVTLNLLRDLSRWDERGPLLAAGLAELHADLIAVQEVRLPHNTARWLADRLEGYSVHLCPKTGFERRREALAVLSRLPVEAADCLDLRSQNRVAQRLRVNVGGRPLVVVNGHYYWWPGESRQRERQIERVLDRLRGLPPDGALVLCGDFNGTPESRAIRLLRARFASAHAARHGREPDYTCPTPLGRPRDPLRHAASLILNLLANRALRPWRGTLDYVFVNDRVRVLECEVVLNCPAPHDPALYPSDHFGLAAVLEL
jgi:endonuclease/exonuclease/phosphatase family metal-dependent hydrolase